MHVHARALLCGGRALAAFGEKPEVEEDRQREGGEGIHMSAAIRLFTHGNRRAGKALSPRDIAAAYFGDDNWLDYYSPNPPASIPTMAHGEAGWDILGTVIQKM